MLLTVRLEAISNSLVHPTDFCLAPVIPYSSVQHQWLLCALGNQIISLKI